MNNDNGRDKRWTMEIRLDDDGPTTTAFAVIQAGGCTMTSSGQVRINPNSQAMRRSRKQVAASRALSKLADQLLDAAVDDYRAGDDSVREAVAI